MSVGENSGEMPITSLVETDLQYTIDSFDVARNGFEQAFREYSKCPSPENYQLTIDAGGVIASTLSKSVEHILTIEPDVESQILLIQGLMVSEREERANIFKSLTKCEDEYAIRFDFSNIDRDEFRTVLETEGVEAVTALLVGPFIESHAMDLEHYKSHIDSQPEAIKFHKNLARKAAIKKYLYDVSYVAVGVATGVAVTKLLFKKRD